MLSPRKTLSSFSIIFFLWFAPNKTEKETIEIRNTSTGFVDKQWSSKVQVGEQIKRGSAVDGPDGLSSGKVRD